MFAFLSTHVRGYCHPWLGTEIRLVWSYRFTIMTVDILLQEPVSLYLVDVNIYCGNLLTSGVWIGLVSMRTVEDVRRWCLLALLRPFVIGLSSEVLTFFQSMQNIFICGICDTELCTECWQPSHKPALGPQLVIFQCCVPFPQDWETNLRLRSVTSRSRSQRYLTSFSAVIHNNCTRASSRH